MSPRSSLVVLSIILFVTTGLSIGLTYAPCYSALCSEEVFPFETRLHIGIFGALLLTLMLCFFLRAKFLFIRQFSERLICKHRLPLLEAKVTYGGILITTWILFVVLVTTAIWLEIVPWWSQHLSFLQNVSGASVTAAVTSIIGHHVDLVLGLVIIPVPRHSKLCEAFGFPSSTLIWAHKALAYLLLLGTVAHGAAYLAFIGTIAQDPVSQRERVSILNPYVTDNLPARLGSYALAEFPSGLVSVLLLVIITITALTYFRRRHFELFYYTHVILGVLFMIFTCIHASTNFYCLLPGLALWAWDWGWRLFGGTGLGRNRKATIEMTETGWIRVTVIPEEKSTTTEKSTSQIEFNPLSTYYINLPSVSKAQCHPMSAITAQSKGELQFLFAPSAPDSKEQQWTTGVGNLSSLEHNQTIIHLEGPYLPSIPDLQSMSHIVCIVGGTGITGALSIADWWCRTQPLGQQLTIIWTIRDPRTALLAEWRRLNDLVATRPSLHLLLHITSKSGRLDIGATLAQILDQSIEKTQRSWVYLSGPAGLIRSGEDACLNIQKTLKENSVQMLEYYTAIWE